MRAVASSGRGPLVRCLVGGALAALGSPALAQPLETETARLVEPSHMVFGAAVEYQRSSEGYEVATPVSLELGLWKNWELRIEPVPYTAIAPKSGKTAQGIGDTEVTLTTLLAPETERVPAFALAGELKIPTARDRRIGTKEADFNLTAIASKRFGDLDVSANIGYTFMGKPSGVEVKNPLNFALGAEYRLNDKWDLVGEFLYTTSAVKSGSGEGTGAATSSEAAGEEFSGTAGLLYHFTPRFDGFGTVSYDNSNATLFRFGVVLKF